MTALEGMAAAQVLYREVNERIRSIGGEMFDASDDDDIAIVCECARPDCCDRITLSGTHYGGVRSSRARFVILPGHEETEIEKVVERHPSYLVVEKDAALVDRLASERGL